MVVHKGTETMEVLGNGGWDRGDGGGRGGRQFGVSFAGVRGQPMVKVREDREVYIILTRALPGHPRTTLHGRRLTKQLNTRTGTCRTDC